VSEQDKQRATTHLKGFKMTEKGMAKD